MNRFRQRLLKADARISRAFAEEVPAVLSVGAELRPVTVIFETPYRVTHIGADEEGRTRVTLAYGAPGKVQPDINKWS